jgi:hypothetical protein
VPLVFSDRERLDTSPRGSESMLAFLDRVAGPFWDRVRQLLEDWVYDYSPEDRAELVGHMRSGRDLDFIAAYWELILYHGLRALGFQVTCHPDVPGTSKHPDFLVEGDACSFYLEAKILGEDLNDRQRDQAHNDIYHKLNMRVQSDNFFVSVQFDKEGSRPIPIRKFAKEAQAWLDGLDPEEIRKEEKAAGPLGVTPWTWEDERSGWSVTLVPTLKSSGKPSDRVVGLMMGSGEASFIDDRTPIRKALDEKARRYGNEFDRPFVIALGIVRAFADDIDVVDALFGDDILIFDPSTGVGKPMRRPNGLLMGPNGPRCRRVSGVLIAGYVAPWLSAKTDLKLWKNPWATFPLECDAGGVITTIQRTDNGALTAAAATMSTGELFRLAPDWPGPEPAFPR